MNKFKKLTVAVAVSAVVSGVVAPATQAAIQGVPGEALLVPFVLYADGAQGNRSVNTYIALTAPAIIGQDTVFNQYTAPNTTGSGSYTMPAGTVTDTGDHNKLGLTYHWFFFDATSKHIINQEGILTPNDVDTIDWADTAETLAGNTLLDGTPGYMVITTNAPVSATPPGSVAANFVMFGDATMHFNGVTGEYAYIPVMAMADGVDGDFANVPMLGDEVLYNAISGVPSQVSPVVTGIRMNNGDQDGIDTVVFDMVIGGPINATETLQVLWFDRNGSGTANVVIYDEEENSCSSSIDINMELNLVLIDADANTSQNLTQPGPTGNITGVEVFCDPSFDNGNEQEGFVLYSLAELGDTLLGAVDSGAVAFSIVAGGSFGVPTGVAMNGPWPGAPISINTALAHERGKIDN